MRSPDTFPFYVEGVDYEEFDGLAGTHCEIDSEFQTDKSYIPEFNTGAF